MGYHERREAVTNLGVELRKRGVKLLGWKDDRSRPEEDYYSREDWKGIGEKGGLIIIVGCTDYEVQYLSGKPEIRRLPTDGGPCGRCAGSGCDPDGWTLQSARESPEAFNESRIRATYKGEASVSVRAGTPGVASPLHFHPDGRQKCCGCHGSGRVSGKPVDQVLYVYPEFVQVPKGYFWTIQDGKGVILAKGKGQAECLDGRASQVAEKVEAALVTALRKVIGLPAEPAAVASNN